MENRIENANYGNRLMIHFMKQDILTQISLSLCTSVSLCYAFALVFLKRNSRYFIHCIIEAICIARCRRFLSLFQSVMSAQGLVVLA